MAEPSLSAWQRTGSLSGDCTGNRPQRPRFGQLDTRGTGSSNEGYLRASPFRTRSVWALTPGGPVPRSLGLWGSTALLHDLDPHGEGFAAVYRDRDIVPAIFGNLHL